MQSRTAFLCAISLLTVLTGCSGGGSSESTADFTLAIAPSAVTIIPGGAAQTITVTASPVNGFTGNVSVAVGALPSGVTATPMTLVLESRWVAADYCDCQTARCSGKRQHLAPGTYGLSQS